MKTIQICLQSESVYRHFSSSFLNLDASKLPLDSYPVYRTLNQFWNHLNKIKNLYTRLIETPAITTQTVDLASACTLILINSLMWKIISTYLNRIVCIWCSMLQLNTTAEPNWSTCLPWKPTNYTLRVNTSKLVFKN